MILTSWCCLALSILSFMASSYCINHQRCMLQESLKTILLYASLFLTFFLNVTWYVGCDHSGSEVKILKDMMTSGSVRVLPSPAGFFFFFFLFFLSKIFFFFLFFFFFFFFFFFNFIFVFFFLFFFFFFFFHVFWLNFYFLQRVFFCYSYLRSITSCMLFLCFSYLISFVCFWSIYVKTKGMYFLVVSFNLLLLLFAVLALYFSSPELCNFKSLPRFLLLTCRKEFANYRSNAFYASYSQVEVLQGEFIAWF